MLVWSFLLCVHVGALCFFGGNSALCRVYDWVKYFDLDFLWEARRAVCLLISMFI